MPHAYFVTETTPRGLRVTVSNPLFFDAFRQRNQRLDDANLEGLPVCRLLDTSPPSRDEDVRGQTVEVQTIQEARALALQCIDLVAKLHAEGMVHGAIERSALRTEDGVVVLGAPAPLLVPGMDACPDVFAGGTPGPRMDIWALGQLLLELGNEVDDDLLCHVGAWTTNSMDPAKRPSLAAVREQFTQQETSRRWPAVAATSVALALCAISFLL
jgi:hypothetical protein